MRFIPNENTDPAVNLAMEEYILSGMDLQENVLFFFIDKPSIIVGRHQNTHDEINESYVNTHNIQVVRRLSGGGAVYHDFGNLCYSFIIPHDQKQMTDFHTFTMPVVNALRNLGAPVALSGRNDLLLNGLKISGNAYYHNQFGSVCHGTLLFDSDLSILAQALKVQPEKFQNKGIQSVRSRVTNLKPFLPQFINIYAFREALLHEIIGKSEDICKTEFTASDLHKIDTIAKERYRTWEWNYGKSPIYNIHCKRRFQIGNVEVFLQTTDGIIQEIHLFGDFFTPEDPYQIEKELTGIPYESESLYRHLNRINFEKIFSGISTGEFVSFLTKSDFTSP